jgi:hypothetical protein
LGSGGTHATCRSLTAVFLIIDLFSFLLPQEEYQQPKALIIEMADQGNAASTFTGRGGFAHNLRAVVRRNRMRNYTGQY